ncbi:hypothetical protein AURDEDRAFT_170672 [Auricularia subglabra TFB-10046 SS5]|nr:hypothetical protein AURDEDRAFT_170672 [Auricularia subglabra TFB-10046 SS5]
MPKVKIAKRPVHLRGSGYETDKSPATRGRQRSTAVTLGPVRRPGSRRGARPKGRGLTSINL